MTSGQSIIESASDLAARLHLEALGIALALGDVYAGTRATG
jgi:hypothetical protein